MISFSWPEEGFKEDEFTIDFIYDLHGLVGIDGPNEFAKMLLERDKELCKVFCLKWKEYNKTEYWKTKK